MVDKELLTIPQAALELGVSQSAIRVAIHENRLPHVQMYERKLVSREDLEVYRQRSQPTGEKRVGRPRKQEIEPMAADISEGVEAGEKG